MENKNVLMLSYYYPPANFIAGRRAYGISKYLLDYGWKPYIMTIDWTNQNINMMGIDKYLQHSEIKTDVIRLPYRANMTYPFFEKLKRWGRTMLYPPKSFYDYYDGVKNLCLSFLSEKRINAVWATYPGAATHLLANEIKQKYNIPWIADFRDLWDQNYSGFGYSLFRLRYIMPKLIMNCHEVTTVSPGLAEKLSKITDKQINCIYNGFDPDEYVEKRNCYHNDKFTIVYTGTFIPEMSPLPVFKACKQLLDSNEIEPSDVRLLFYGSGGEILTKMACDSGIMEIFQMHDPISHSHIPAIQKNASVLLHLSHPKLRGIMTGKIFEYHAAHRPILSVPGDNDCVQELLNKTKAGIWRASIDSIAAQIKSWYDEWRISGRIEYRGIDSEIENYSYRESSKQMAQILDRIIY